MKVLLIDGYNMLYRMRSVHLPVDPERGINPVTFTFFRSLRAVIEKFNPDRVYFVTEGRPKERLALMESYKGQRTYHDKDDFQRQKHDIIRIMSDYIPVHMVNHPDYECDDVLAAYACIKHRDDECVVVSTDTDFFQLFVQHKNIKIYNPVKKDFVTPVTYDYVTYKSLKGDLSDNIPGIPGIGDKKAKSLLEDNKKLEALLSKDDNRLLFERNKKLVRFHDMTEELSNVTETCALPAWSVCRELFKEMNFVSIVNDMSWFKFVMTFRKLS